MQAKQELFLEIDRHLTEDEKPSLYLNAVSEKEEFLEYPFFLLNREKETEQLSSYHLEGNVWNHTMLTVDMAAGVKQQSRDPRAFMWAALLHDAGKPETSRMLNGKLTHYDHDKAGYEITKNFLKEFTDDAAFIGRVAALVRWHMQLLYVVDGADYADAAGMKRDTDAAEIALLGLCDRLGRIGANRQEVEETIRVFLEKVK